MGEDSNVDSPGDSTVIDVDSLMVYVESSVWGVQMGLNSGGTQRLGERCFIGLDLQAIPY